MTDIVVCISALVVVFVLMIVLALQMQVRSVSAKLDQLINEMSKK